MDEITELADWMTEAYRRGEELDDLEFRLAGAAFTDEGRDEFMALMVERAAHGEEKLEALREDVRILYVLLDLIERSGASPGTTLGQALQGGFISVLEVIEAARAVPDPLAGQPH